MKKRKITCIITYTEFVKTKAGRGYAIDCRIYRGRKFHSYPAKGRTPEFAIRRAIRILRLQAAHVKKNMLIDNLAERV